MEGQRSITSAAQHYIRGAEAAEGKVHAHGSDMTVAQEEMEGPYCCSAPSCFSCCVQGSFTGE